MRVKAAGALLGAAALGFLGIVPDVTGGAPPAFGQSVVTTGKYTIGNGTVTGATAVPQPDTAGATANYTVGFTTPSALAGGSDTVTLSSPEGAVTFPSGTDDYFVIDNTHPTADQAVSKVTLGSGGHSATLVLSASVPAGSSLSVYVIGATNPATAGTYSLEVATSENPVAASTADFSVVGASAAPSFDPTASPALIGGVSTYTIGTFKATSAVAAGGTIVITSSAPAGTDDNVGFPTVPSYYKVVDLTTGASGAPTAVAVNPVGSGRTGQEVLLTVGSAIAAGDELSVAIDGVRNPTSPQSDLISAAAPNGAAASTASLEIGTSVASPAISLSQTGAGASGVEYTVSFKPSTSVPAGGTVTFVAPPGTSFGGATVTLVDLTHVTSSAGIAPASVQTSATSGSSTPNQVTFTVPKPITGGDSVFVELRGVTNPPAGTYGGSAGNFTVATSTDVVPAPVPSYIVTGAPAPLLATIEVNPTAPQASAVYTIGDLRATANLLAGSATIVVSAPQGTVLPGAPLDYTVADLSDAAGTAHPASVTGGGTATVTLGLGANIAAGSFVEVIAAGVVNPGPGTYQVSLTGDLQAAVAPPTPVPPKPPAVANTSTSISATSNPARVGEAVTFTATVSPAPTAGAVVFLQGGRPIARCTSKPLYAGRATCTVTYWKGGRHTLQALYTGSASFRRSASAVMTEAVAFPPVGYWLLTRTGAVFGLEGAPNLGGFSPNASTGDVASIAGTPTGKGYWVVTSNGTVQAFGDAHFYGDPPDIGVHPHDIVAIAPTFDGKGYWLIGADGGMFTFGDARFYGSIPGLGLHVHDIVGMVANATGGGYLLVGADGGVFTFGKARFYGSLPGIHKHVHDIRSILPAAAGTGYVLVGSDGGAFVFGVGVRFLGSLPGEGVHVHDIVGLALTPDNGGYFMAGADGNVYGFGDAHPSGMPSGLPVNLPVVAIAGT
jgi:hypothetical protein